LSRYLPALPRALPSDPEALAVSVAFTLLIAVCALPLTLVTLVLTIEVIAGLRPLKRSDPPPLAGDAVIVVPAHDEAAILASTLARLKNSLSDGVSILVVADNCIDETAAIARAQDVGVIERSDREKRGQGFALAYARDHIASWSHSPRVVVILDADCDTDQRSLSQLIAAAAQTERPAQTVNLLRPAAGAAPMVQVSTFAFLIKNLVRQRGLQRLSGGVLLTGTGMAFPWAVFRRAALATDDVVEDLGLGLDLARQGVRPMLVEGAYNWSDPSTSAGTLKQRSRWEGGFIATSLRRAWPTALRGLLRGDLRQCWAGLSLAVPPLALLVLANGAVLMLSALLVAAGAAAWPLVMQATVFAAAAIALTVAWWREGRAFLSPAAAARLPLYVLWKVPLYLGLIGRSRREWVRTGR
jgi:cellulose synthase/poly-beta-1,6-N-acetylglucosamine synthase-like glycosyltransferase